MIAQIPLSRFRLLGLIIVSILSCGSLVAQDTGSLSGRVADSRGALLQGAVVSIRGTAYRETTDRTGTFRLTGLPAGTHTVSVSYLGYRSLERTVTIDAGETEVLNLTFSGEEQVFELDAFEVSTYRSEQAAALSQQRAAGNITNVIASDAIGNFPDVNAAEALQRLPGISIENQRGEGRFLIIRGAAPNYNSITMDGASILSSERDGRTVSLDVYPAEQLARIEVTKAITPDLPGDSIGGSVNLVTKRAFDYTGRTINANLHAAYNDIAEDWGYRTGVSYSDVFGSDKSWGLQFSAAESERVSEEHSHEVPPIRYRELTIDGADYTIPDRLIQTVVGIERTRRSISGTLEKKVGDSGYYFLRGTYNRFTEDNDRPLHQLNFNRNRFSDPVSGPDGSIRSVTNDRLDGRRQGNTRTFEDTYYSLAAGGEWKGEESLLSYQASYSIANNTQDSVRGEFNTIRFNDPFTIDFSSLKFPKLGANARDYLNNPENFVFANVRVNDRDVDHDEWAGKVDYERESRMGTVPFTLKTGAQARLANMDSYENTTDYGSFDDGSGNDLVMNDARFGHYEVAGDFLNDRYAFGPSPRDAAFTQFFRKNMDLFGSGSESIQDYEASEDIYAAYVQGTWEWTEVTMLAGFRWERTSIDYDEQGVVGDRPPGAGDFDPSGSYDNFLPSIHLRFRVSDPLQIRFAWSNSIARPEFDRMAPFERINVDSSTGDITINRGNPELDAVESMNWDFMLEYYMEPAGILSAGLFFKEIDGPIFPSSRSSESEGVMVTVNSFFNAGKAEVLGMELNYQKQFVSLPGFMSGFGIMVNATFTDSEVEVPGREGEEFPLFRQSNAIGNVALFYEKSGWNARLAYNWRSSFLREIGNADRLDLYEGDYDRLDLQVGYRFNENWRIQFEATNLTNEPEYIHTGADGLPSFYALTGRTFSVGVLWTY